MAYIGMATPYKNTSRSDAPKRFRTMQMYRDRAAAKAWKFTGHSGVANIATILQLLPLKTSLMFCISLDNLERETAAEEWAAMQDSFADRVERQVLTDLGLPLGA